MTKFQGRVWFGLIFCSKAEMNICVHLLQAVSNKLMAGFVECLDNEEAEEGPETGDGETGFFVHCLNSMLHKP